jgi:DNA-binding transcriptional LysR family regulator
MLPSIGAKVHNLGMFDWSDLRYFLAVAREGSTLAAAKSLGVNQSTVHRRLAALEQSLGKPLATRSPTGYQLTEFGRTFLPYARSVEDAILAAEIGAEGYDAQPHGIVRLSVPEPLVGRLTTSGLISRFRERFPDLKIEFAIADRYLDLWRGEADVALRSGDPEDPRLVGRKVADSVWAIYASDAYVAQHGRPATVADLKAHAVVGFDGAMTAHRASTWIAETLPGARIVARNASVLGVLTAVKAGIGVAPLPVTIAEGEAGLVQVLPPVPALQRGWYLLTRPDLRRQPRIAALFDYMIAELPALQRVLMG